MASPYIQNNCETWTSSHRPAKAHFFAENGDWWMSMVAAVVFTNKFIIECVCIGRANETLETHLTQKHWTRMFYWRNLFANNKSNDVPSRHLISFQLVSNSRTKKENRTAFRFVATIKHTSFALISFDECKYPFSCGAHAINPLLIPFARFTIAASCKHANANSQSE